MALELLSDLKSSSSKENVESFLESLLEKINKIVTTGKPDDPPNELFNEDLVVTLSDLLVKYDDKRLNFLTLAILAEVAKTDSGRLLCANVKVIKSVLNFLLCQSSYSTSNPSFQACRVLGNTCFDCDVARDIVKECNGESLILKLLKDLCNDGSNPDHVRIACGAFLNLILDHESLQISALSLGVLDTCCQIMTTFYQHDDLMKSVLYIIESLSVHGRKICNYLKSEEFMESFIIILKETVDQELVDLIFQILNGFCENEELKLAISCTKFSEKLCNLIEEKDIEKITNFTELASDFIILLLTGDESMNLLFDNGNGQLFEKLKSWLSLSKPLKLQTAAAFAMCNIARSDKNCVYFVENGIADDILVHLRHYPVDAKQPILQYALIRTLTNLSITTGNKFKMIEKGVIDECLQYLESESFTVVFKSLGTIRMLLDKNDKVACQLGQNETFLGKLRDFSSLKEHEGIRCESWRIMASMVKSSRDSGVMKALLNHNLADSLLKLLQSKHLIMRNEAILSLLLLLSNLDENPIEGHENAFCEELKVFLSIESSLPEEILSNVLILVKKCQRLPSMRPLIAGKEFSELLIKHEHHSNENIQQLIRDLRNYSTI